MTGKVYLVGAGPGDPGLITVKGMWALEQAQVVVYDRLVDPVLLQAVPDVAERIFVGKARGRQQLTQPEINQLLVDKASQGFTVVRLKGGDPFVFGRGGEEAEALRSEGVGVEVVPGITSAIAGPAAAGIPVTMRGHASGFTVITGHQDPTNARSIDWEAAARLGTTLIVLMGASRADLIAERLLLGGLDADTPVAVVESATMPDQQVVRTVLADLPGTPVHAPAILVIGSVAGLDVTDAGLEDLVATTAHAASEHGGSSWLN